MRKHKYKVYDGENIITLGQAIKTGIVGIQDHQETCELECFYEHVKLLEFTGLTDKNDVEMYEGDVVQTFVPTYEDEANINEVIFKNGSFRLHSVKERVEDIALACYKNKNIEVIGNIYQEKYKHLRGE